MAKRKIRFAKWTREQTRRHVEAVLDSMRPKDISTVIYSAEEKAIIWNCEGSIDRENLARYHFVLIGYAGINVQNITTIIRDRLRGNNFKIVKKYKRRNMNRARYGILSFDSDVSPEEADIPDALGEFGVYRDVFLREARNEKNGELVPGGLERYVAKCLKEG